MLRITLLPNPSAIVPSVAGYRPPESAAPNIQSDLPAAGMSAAAFNTTIASACVVPFNKYGRLKESLTPSNRTTGYPFRTPVTKSGRLAEVAWVASLWLVVWSDQRFTELLVIPASARSQS